MIQSEADLIEENYGLAVSISNKFYKANSLYSFEDLIQVSLLAMIKAHRQYNEDKAVFSTFATYCMRNDLIKFVNKNKSTINIDSIDIPFEKETTIDDISPKNLTNEEAEVLRYKKDGYKDVEIRRKLKISPARMKAITQSCFDKIVRANA